MTLPEPYYQDSAVTIYNADCREILPLLQKVDLVFTSPFYNLGEGMEDKGGFRVGHPGSKWSGATLQHGYGDFKDNMPYSDYVAFQKSVLLLCWDRLNDEGAIFYNHKPRVVKGVCRLPTDLVPGLPLRQVIIWNRSSGFNFSETFYAPKCEWILILAKPKFTLRDKSASGVGDVWDASPDNEIKGHPATFPVKLPAIAVETTGAELILDPFMGSGTTLRAAKDLGRKAIGIEISEEYCAIAAKRMRQEVFAF